jgi:hypothetical protein
LPRNPLTILSICISYFPKQRNFSLAFCGRSPPPFVFHISTFCKYFYEYPTAPDRATIDRFHMTINAKQSANEIHRRKSNTTAAERKALTPNILIATPRLEFHLTHSKQKPLIFSNRDYIAVFQALPLASSHSPVATGSLIYGAAIRNPRNLLKT